VEVLGVKADPPQAIEEVPVWVLDGSEPYFLEPKLVKTIFPWQTVPILQRFLAESTSSTTIPYQF
jgi:hypothetical protein